MELKPGGAIMMTHSELEGKLKIEYLVEASLCDLSLKEVKTSDQKSRTIGGQRGVLGTLEWLLRVQDVSMKAFVAGVEHCAWANLILAASMLD